MVNHYLSLYAVSTPGTEWLKRYQVKGYDKGITLADRLSMVYTGDDGQALFTSHAWRRLSEVRGLLVREFILDFFSTCRMSDTEM
ncbi:hypothetical protein Tco_0310422, partial [Tanacetum coccineum]